MTDDTIDRRYYQPITIVADTIVNSRLLFPLSTLLPIVETAIDFPDSCLCGLKLISFRQNKRGCLHHGIVKQTKKNDILIICLFITGININCLIN